MNQVEITRRKKKPESGEPVITKLSRTVDNVTSVASAVLKGKLVDQTTIDTRFQICSQCPYVRDVGGKLSCGICGCKLSGDKSVLNLVKYEETARYGCKHPEGSQWKKHQV